jgi:hypothetical protein
MAAAVALLDKVYRLLKDILVVATTEQQENSLE